MSESTPQSIADGGADGSTSSSSPQSARAVDPAMTASGDVLLAAAATPTQSLDDGNSADPDFSVSEAHASAVVQSINADSEVPAVTAALAPDASEATNDSFHLSAAADAFWFKLDEANASNSGAEPMDDQSALVADLTSTHSDAGGELAFSATLASLFHDNGGAGQFDRNDSAVGGGSFIASDSGALSGVVLGDTARFDGTSIIVAPTVASPSATAPSPWIVESSGTGGTSGSWGGTSHTSPIVNHPSGGLVINVVYDPSVSNAPAGFISDVQAVVSYFESRISNPITITIDVGYGEVDGYSLGSGALGESITYFDQVSYAQLQSALTANLKANGYSAAAGSLPATSPVSGQWWVSTAEAEALGITSASNNPDGYVGFSSASNIFAYNDSNGVPSNQYDFIAVVAHEISEVMGRQMFDGTNAFGTGASYDPLDLFHYAASGVRDFTAYTGYASADGGKTSLDSFNTIGGGDFADWASSAGNDAFNAFANPGVVNSVTQSDLTELNLLGWNPVAATAPTTPVVTMQLAGDTGWSSTDRVTSKDTLTGTADPNATVTIALGTTVLGTAAANTSGVWSFTPAGLADGQYTVTASETNAAGLTGAASINFALDTSTPLVTSETVSGTGISGGSGILTVDEVAVFTLTMSEAVAVSSGTPALTLSDGGKAIYDAADSSPTSLVFDYTVAAGQYANALSVTGINLNGATVTEIAGNAANFSSAVTAFPNLVVDATTPQVVPYVGHSIGGVFGLLTLNNDGSYSYNNTNSSAVTAAGEVTEDLTIPNDVYLTGAAGGTLRAGSGSYVLDGSAGGMTVTAGNQGQQWLVGGDTLNDGKSMDTFMFAPGFGKETINNFNPSQDVIDLPQSMFANFAAVQADLHASGGNTMIVADANDVITLSHVWITSLHPQNFHFLV